MSQRTPNTSAQRLTLVTLAVIALVVVGVIVYFRVAPQQSQTSSASSDIDVTDQPMLGEESAPAEIAVFEDFKCPACQFFDAEVMPQLERELIDTGQARIYFFNFPFIGADSTTAAIAGECVYRQDNAAFWDYKTFVFRSQGPESEAWATPAALAEIARANVPSIDADALQSCTEDETYAEQVSDDQAMGNSAGVSGTPTVFVNGVAMENFEFATIQEAVAAAQDN